MKRAAILPLALLLLAACMDPTRAPDDAGSDAAPGTGGGGGGGAGGQSSSSSTGSPPDAGPSICTTYHDCPVVTDDSSCMEFSCDKTGKMTDPGVHVQGCYTQYVDKVCFKDGCTGTCQGLPPDYGKPYYCMPFPGTTCPSPPDGGN